MAHCVGRRYRTKGGVFNAMNIYGMEAAPLSKTEEAKSSLEAAASSEGQDKLQSYGESAPSSECVVCLENPRDTAMFPCRHLCVCMPCATAMARQQTRCPMCRVPVTFGGGSRMQKLSVLVVSNPAAK